MELSQPRKFGDEGRKTTHDFLSLYSPAQQDPLPSQGNYLKTHDFLQGSGKNGASRDNNLEVSTVEKPPPPAPPPEPSITHILPGGIGTYSISYYEQKAIKQEGIFSNVAQVNSAERNDENSNCSSYSGSGFALWDESASKTGKTGKENIALERHNLGETSINLEDGPWTTSLEQRSHSSASHKLNNTALSSLSSSKQPIEKYPSFTNLLRSSQMAEEDDNEEFVIKKETSNLNDNLTVRVDGRSGDKKPSTPRSKHSATEQRRRCKINDRFQKLREIIPHGDQKRDKASFLLEVIEYIQYLQEKVHRYEEPDQGGNPEPSKEVIQQPEFPNKTQKQQPVFPFGATFSSGLAFDMNKPAPQQPHVHFQPRTADGAAISDHKVEDQAQQQSIESGTIRISSVYSQQLLNSLTQALQHSGVDLSRASVAVQIDLGKRAKSGLSPSISTSKDNIPMNMSNQARSRSLTAVTEEEYDQALKKRLKTSIN